MLERAEKVLPQFLCTFILKHYLCRIKHRNIWNWNFVQRRGRCCLPVQSGIWSRSDKRWKRAVHVVTGFKKMAWKTAQFSLVAGSETERKLWLLPQYWWQIFRRKTDMVDYKEKLLCILKELVVLRYDRFSPW